MSKTERVSIAIFAIWTLSVIAASITVAFGEAEPRPLRETDWSKRIAAEWREAGIEAETEARQPDGSRVDILTATDAVEVEWCHGGKWKEAIGQAVLYGIQTNRRPCVLLLIKGDEAERVEYLRCLAVCAKCDIKIATYKVTE